MSAYSSEQLLALYELGRLYYDMGYLTAAERIFNGVSALDDGQTPARLGLGLVKLEHGLIDEALVHFRGASRNELGGLEAKVAMCSAFVAGGDLARAASLLTDMQRELASAADVAPELRTLYTSLRQRVGM